jgi:hypothetical protein
MLRPIWYCQARPDKGGHMQPRTQLDTQYRNLAFICGAMVTGQLLFAAVAWFLNANATEPNTHPIMGPITYAWLAVLLIGVSVAIYLRQRLATMGDTLVSQQDIRTGKLNFGVAQSQTIIMFAMLEAGGLLGLVNYFLNPHPRLLMWTLLYIAFVTVFFFPRRAWFDPLQPS